jgi:hypothetical protein
MRSFPSHPMQSKFMSTATPPILASRCPSRSSPRCRRAERMASRAGLWGAQRTSSCGLARFGSRYSPISWRRYRSTSCLLFSSTAEPSAQPDDSVDLAIRDLSLRRLVLRRYFFPPEQTVITILGISGPILYNKTPWSRRHNRLNSYLSILIKYRLIRFLQTHYQSRSAA